MAVTSNPPPWKTRAQANFLHFGKMQEASYGGFQVPQNLWHFVWEQNHESLALMPVPPCLRFAKEVQDVVWLELNVLGAVCQMLFYNWLWFRLFCVSRWVEHFRAVKNHFVRSGIRTHAWRTRLRPERSTLDRSAILTGCWCLIMYIS